MHLRPYRVRPAHLTILALASMPSWPLWLFPLIRAGGPLVWWPLTLGVLWFIISRPVRRDGPLYVPREWERDRDRR